MDQATLETIIRLLWLLGAAAFVFGLHQMNSPATARRGNQISAVGMAIAVLGTIVLIATRGGVQTLGWPIIAAGVIVGGGLGLYTARTVKMTAMPQLVSLFNAVGGGAAALIGIDDYIRLAGLGGTVPIETTVATVLDVIIGSVTFTGSLIASGKLQGLVPGRPIRIPGGQLVTIVVAAAAVIGAAYLIFVSANVPVLFLIIAVSLIFGITMVLPIGGADMPVVIS